MHSKHKMEGAIFGQKEPCLPKTEGKYGTKSKVILYLGRVQKIDKEKSRNFGGERDEGKKRGRRHLKGGGS